VPATKEKRVEYNNKRGIYIDLVPVFLLTSNMHIGLIMNNISKHKIKDNIMVIIVNFFILFVSILIIYIII
jgi:hypothetical protein